MDFETDDEITGHLKFQSKPIKPSEFDWLNNNINLRFNPLRLLI